MMNSARHRPRAVIVAVARAPQAERMRRVGALIPFAENDAEARPWLPAFDEGLQRLGWVQVETSGSIIVLLALTRSVCGPTPLN